VLSPLDKDTYKNCPVASVLQVFPFWTARNVFRVGRPTVVPVSGLDLPSSRDSRME